MVDSAHSYEPPRGPLKATLIDWGRGKTLFRVHEERFAANAFNPSRSGNARFSPIYSRTKEVISTLYAGSSLGCALMETVFHDVPYKAGFKPLSRTRLLNRVHSILLLNRDLRSDAFSVRQENSPQHATTHKGKIRIALEKKPEHYGNACKVVLNKYGSSYSVRSPAFLPGTGCSRAESGLFHFTASDATSA